MTLEETVVWAHSEWRDEMETVGYIIHENSNFVVIAATIDKSERPHNFHDVSMIPKSVILPSTEKSKD